MSAQAETCNGPGPIGFGGLPEKQITIHVKKDTPCTITFGHRPFAFFRQTLIKRPRGIYGLAGTIFGAYQPPRGYVGDDYFEVLLTYRGLGDGQGTLRTTLKVTAVIAE